MSAKGLEKARDFFRRIIVEDNSSYSIAMGTAVGIFIGLMPIFGFQMIPAVIISMRLKVNKMAAAAGVWITNPFTVIPIYLFNYWVGAKCLSMESLSREYLEVVLSELTLKKALELGITVFGPLTVGSVINGLVASTVVYFGVKWLVESQHHFSKK